MKLERLKYIPNAEQFINTEKLIKPFPKEKESNNLTNYYDPMKLRENLTNHWDQKNKLMQR